MTVQVMILDMLLTIQKIKNDLGWSPKYSFENGLSKTIDWYCNNKKWYQDLMKSDYLSRLGVIK